jgi:hypothetical protein
VSKKTMKKLTLVCAAVAALALAGAGGAVIRYTIFTIKPSHYARLAGTDVYCQHGINKTKQHAFTCVIENGTHPTPKTYTIVLGQPGVVVARWPQAGTASRSSASSRTRDESG